jgi:hypothetical protein
MLLVCGIALPITFGEYIKGPDVVIFSLNAKMSRVCPCFIVCSIDIKTGAVVSLSPPDGGTGLAQECIKEITRKKGMTTQVFVCFLLIIMEKVYLPKCTSKT